MGENPEFKDIKVDFIAPNAVVVDPGSITDPEVMVRLASSLFASHGSLEKTKIDGADIRTGSTPGTDALISIYRAWVKDSFAMCEHHPLFEELVFWSPMTRVFQCVDCMGESARAAAGTPEDYTCDLCRKVFDAGTSMRVGSITLPTEGRVEGHLVATVVIFYGLCTDCDNNGGPASEQPAADS